MFATSRATYVIFLKSPISHDNTEMKKKVMTKLISLIKHFLYIQINRLRSISLININKY